MVVEGEPGRLEAAPALDEIRELREEIAYHDDLYYRQSAPVISDSEYDELKRRLVALERDHPEFAAGSIIGDDRLVGLEKERHVVPMLSLDKEYSKSGLADFDERVRSASGSLSEEYIVEPKFDGMAISVVYEEGRFVGATTRGNGREGDDVSENVRRIEGVPMELVGGSLVPLRIELRGEVYLEFAAFDRINVEREARAEAPYRSIRSLAAGSVKLLDSDAVEGRRLSVVFFGYGDFEPADRSPDSQEDFYVLAGSWGLPVVKGFEKVRGLSELQAAVERIEAQRDSYSFPTDGAVVKVNSRRLQVELGSSETAPRWALAYKFITQRVATRLLGITLQVGRTGVVTPVAELEPVDVLGSRISRANLHNFGVIESKGIRIGDTVILEKAGEVIPAIIGIDLSKRPLESVSFVDPVACPSCGSRLQSESSGVTLRCLSLDCPVQLQRKLEHFASKDGVNMVGIGPARIAAWVEAGELETVADFYRIAAPGGVGATIADSKGAALWRFVNGLGIPGIGETRSRALADAFGSLQAIAAVSPRDFAEGGLGEGLGFGDLALSYFASEGNRRVVEELLQLGVRPARERVARGDRLAGKVFVITGRLEGFTREEAQRAIEASGGVVRGSVSGRTDYLVLGTGAGAKLAEAQERGVEIIDEAALLGLLE